MTRSRERTASPASGSIGSGAVTAAGLAVQQGLAAVVGVIIARELGRSGETDGFFAAYGVFLVLAIAATAARVVFLPPLARARDEGRLLGETVGFGLALAIVALPVMLVAVVGADGLASVLTGFDEGLARETAAASCPGSSPQRWRSSTPAWLRAPSRRSTTTGRPPSDMRPEACSASHSSSRGSARTGSTPSFAASRSTGSSPSRFLRPRSRIALAEGAFALA